MTSARAVAQGLLAASLAAALVAVVARIIADWRLVTCLRRQHTAIWDALGRPSPWFSKLEDLGAVHRFLFTGACDTHADAALRARCRRVRRLHLASYVLPLAAILLATAAKAMGSSTP